MKGLLLGDLDGLKKSDVSVRNGRESLIKTDLKGGYKIMLKFSKDCMCRALQMSLG